jgi:AAA15 family ATPase/GTPase
VERLANFDKNINTIDILNNDVYIGFEGINEMLPLGMSGDGLRRFLNIVASSANPMTNIILIDEIDNGMHYSAYKKLWEAIFALAMTTNKQVSVTTHSKETLYKLNEMLEENPDYQKELRLYTIEKTLKMGIQAYKYT